MICIFRHHINVDEEVESLSKNYYKVRWTAITNCDSFLIQSATRFITNRDRYYKVRWVELRGRVERDIPNFLPDYLFQCTSQLRGCEDAQSFLLN